MLIQEIKNGINIEVDNVTDLARSEFEEVQQHDMDLLDAQSKGR